ncbi:MAG: hypothetical protein WD004_05610 [Actinomycetota bacterium]
MPEPHDQVGAAAPPPAPPAPEPASDPASEPADEPAASRTERGAERRASRGRAWLIAIAVLVLIALIAAAVVALTGGRRQRFHPEPGPGAYRGLGTWVDVYETGVWNDPEGAVERMEARGIETVYLQTSNYSRDTAIVFPEPTSRFIEAAHDADMRVVAWYLPGLIDPKLDLEYSMAAIDFESEGGDRFDSFGLDIEAREVKDPAERSKILVKLSRQIRDAAGEDYPLGAITPNPMRIEHELGYWPGFPYAEIAMLYDVIVPMDYFGAVDEAADKSGAFRYTLDGIRLIREGSDRLSVPIHVIGGLAEDVTAPELRGFLKAAHRGRAIGWSLYNFTTTGDADWAELEAASPPNVPPMSPGASP